MVPPHDPHLNGIEIVTDLVRFVSLPTIPAITNTGATMMTRRTSGPAKRKANEGVRIHNSTTRAGNAQPIFKNTLGQGGEVGRFSASLTARA